MMSESMGSGITEIPIKKFLAFYSGEPKSIRLVFEFSDSYPERHQVELQHLLSNYGFIVESKTVKINTTVLSFNCLYSHVIDFSYVDFDRMRQELSALSAFLVTNVVIVDTGIEIFLRHEDCPLFFGVDPTTS